MTATIRSPRSGAVAATFAAVLIVGACTSTAGPAAPAAPSASPEAMASHEAMASGSPEAVASGAPGGSTTVASGSFHRVDADATGNVLLRHLADGSFTVVFEDLSTGSAANIHVLLLTARDVTRDADVVPTTAIDLGPLSGTTGMQDYGVPAAMSADAMGYHTVVLWDTQMAHAVAAAPLSGG
ncbi:MAG: DM13 domain-containing protein [Candidatus Limnocylindrales bacterium]